MGIADLQIKNDTLIVELNKLEQEQLEAEPIRLVDTSFETSETSEVEEEKLIPKPHGVWSNKLPTNKTKLDLIHTGDVKLDTIEVLILNLNDSKELKQYNQILTDQENPYNNIIIEEIKQWSDVSDSWKVFIKKRTLKFKH